MRGEWPLTGRAAELRRVGALLSERGARGAILAGPAGVGKTRLARECVEMAERAGLATAWATGTRSASALPLGALAPLLPAVTDRGTGGGADRPELFRRLAAALRESAGERRLMLVADDAHLLDDASATLIHQLTATGAAFVLATLRTGETAPDPVVALWKDGVVERIELTGLSTDVIEDLLTFALGGPPDAGAVAQLAVRCQGNVLFLRELVLGALHDGTLREQDGIWRIVGPLSPSSRLVELVEARLAGLEAAERRLLEVAGFAEPLGRAEREALEEPGTAERLERKGILDSRIAGRRLEVGLAHPLYSDVVRAGVPAVRAAEIARLLAEVVERTGARRREDHLRVGTWRLDSGGGHPDILLSAARTARWSYDFPLADRLATAAIQAGAGFDAELLSAELDCVSGRNEQAEVRLAELASRAGDDRQRSRVAVARVDNLAFYMGQMMTGLAVAEGAEATIVDPVWRHEITARRSGIVLVTAGPRAGRELAEPLLSKASGRALAWAALPAAYSLARQGRIEAALRASEQGYQAAQEDPATWYPWFQVYAKCETLAHAGRFEEAEQLATAHYQQALADQSVEEQAYFGWHLAKTVSERGHVRTATRLAREAAANFRALVRPTFLHNVLTTLATALALAGRPAEATEALHTLDGLDLPPEMWRLTAVDLQEARAWTAAAADDLPRARRLLEEAAQLGEEIGDLMRGAAALHGLARLGRAREVTRRLTDLVSDLEGELPAARAAHTLALAERDPERLEGVSASFEAMGAHLLAAEAASDAAVLWRKQGNPRRATWAGGRAATLAERCEGAVTPALRAIETRAMLTAGEQEVALLAAAGRPSKEIASELSLSVRTVENRLQRVYDKLGVSGRSELARSLER